MIIFNFSVIAKPSDTLATRQPDTQGLNIWNMMHEHSVGRMCLVVNEVYEKMVFEDWLKKQRIKPSFYEFLDEDRPQLKAEKVHRVAAVFGKPDWYVDNDPKACAETLKLGIPTLVVGAPYIVRPEWSGLKTIKAWDTLVEEMDSQALKAAEKTWKE